MKHEGETYLGDGLYASSDGWMIMLRAPRADGDHWIGLEPNILASFMAWVEALRAKSDATKDEQ